MSETKVYLGINESDVSLLLDAVESFYEEVDSECELEECQVCGAKRDALNRIREGILENAPVIGYNKG